MKGVRVTKLDVMEMLLQVRSLIALKACLVFSLVYLFLFLFLFLFLPFHSLLFISVCLCVCLPRSKELNYYSVSHTYLSVMLIIVN